MNRSGAATVENSPRFRDWFETRSFEVLGVQHRGQWGRQTVIGPLGRGSTLQMANQAQNPFAMPGGGDAQTQKRFLVQEEQVRGRDQTGFYEDLHIPVQVDGGQQRLHLTCLWGRSDVNDVLVQHVHGDQHWILLSGRQLQSKQEERDTQLEVCPLLKGTAWFQPVHLVPLLWRCLRVSGATRFGSARLGSV